MKQRVRCKRHKRAHGTHALLHCKKKLPMQHGACLGMARRCTLPQNADR
jgi:hypothetical protein